MLGISIITSTRIRIVVSVGISVILILFGFRITTEEFLSTQLNTKGAKDEVLLPKLS